MPGFAEPTWGRVAAVAALATVAMVIGNALATPAHAADVCGDGNPDHPHCYATVPWSPAPSKWFTGAEATQLQVDCMAVNDSGGWGLNHSVWVGEGTSSQRYQRWMEAGLAQGDPEPAAQRYAYWAVKGVDGNYDEHDIGQAWQASTPYDVAIRETSPSSGSWQVTIAGPGVDITSGPAGPESTKSHIIETGLESRDSSNGDASTSAGLVYYDSSGQAHSGWSDGRSHAGGPSSFSGNTEGAWLASYSSWRSDQRGQCQAPNVRRPGRPTRPGRPR